MPSKTDTKTPATETDERPCGCGCGETTKANFRPGHDARHAGSVGRALAANPKDADALRLLAAMTPALRAKAERVAANAVAKEQAKQQAKADKEAAKAKPAA